MLVWIQVALGGAIGALARYGVFFALSKPGAGIFPWATFVVNVLGCLAIGILGTMMLNSQNLAYYRPLLVVGVLGGFTTFSAFGFEAMQLIEAKAWKEAVLYILGTNIAGIAAVFLGMNLSR